MVVEATRHCQSLAATEGATSSEANWNWAGTRACNWSAALDNFACLIVDKWGMKEFLSMFFLGGGVQGD